MAGSMRFMQIICRLFRGKDLRHYCVSGNNNFFLVTYVGEKPWWPIQCPNKRRKKGRLSGEGDEIKFIDLGFERGQVVIRERKKKT